MVLSLLKQGFLFLCLCISWCVAAEPVLIDIDASSNNGAKIGTAIGQQIQKNFPKAAQQYDNYLANLLSPEQFKQLMVQVGTLKAAADTEYKAEVDAIAAVLQLSAADKLGDGQLSPNEFWLLQLLPDLTDVNKGSAFAAANHNNHNPIAARNVDWPHSAGLAQLQTITRYRYEGRILVSVGFAGLVGIINGYNDHGLFVSLLDASEQQVSAVLPAHKSSSFALRTILMQNDRVEPASHALAQNSYARSLQFLLVDQNNAVVLEQPLGASGALRRANSEITNEMSGHLNGQWVVVDCFVLKTSPRNCYNTIDFYRWGRFAELLRTLPAENLSVANVISLMLDQANSRQAIFSQRTLQSMVFTPKDQVLYLYTQTALAPNAQPLFEKYQLVKSAATATDKWLDIGLLVLGVAVLAAGWVYVFRDGKLKSPQP